MDTKLTLNAGLFGGWRIVFLWFRTAKQKNVTFRRVNHVVNPTGALLNSQCTPLRLAHQSVLRHHSRHFFWHMNVAVLVFVVVVLGRVVEFVG